MAKIDLIDNSWVDLVFEGKNQAYGAYQLRNHNVRWFCYHRSHRHR